MVPRASTRGQRAAGSTGFVPHREQCSAGALSSATTGQIRAHVLSLAIDIGTSSCRAALVDQGGRTFHDAAARQTYRVRTTPDGGAELDPYHLLEQVCGIVDQVLREAPTRPIVAVAVTTFWHGLMGVDRSGEPATPVYLWLDARGRDDATALAVRLDAGEVHQRTGCPVHWSYWPAKLRWLRRTDPETWAGVAGWRSFGDFLLHRLTGDDRTSLSMMSATGLYDQVADRWAPDLTALLEVDPAALPTPRPLAGEGPVLRPAYADRWPALAAVPWLPAIGDGATSNVGAGCTERRRAALMVGTSLALRVLWRTPRLPAALPGGWRYRLDEQTPVVGGAMNDGGSLIAWLRASLRLGSWGDAARAVAAIEPDSHGLTVLPFWGGERSLGWAPDARGAILGLRLHTDPAAILRAALESIAIQAARLLDALEAGGERIDEVTATGAALVKSAVWPQIMADALNRPVTVAAASEASSRGAALVAFEARGLLPGGIEGVPSPRGRRYEPRADAHARYRAARARMEAQYETVVLP